MTEQYTPRENIADHLVELSTGELILLKSPMDWKEGEEMRKGSPGSSGIDVNKLCEMVCENTEATEITYDQMYRMCEQLLQMEEANPGRVFPQ